MAPAFPASIGESAVKVLLDSSHGAAVLFHKLEEAGVQYAVANLHLPTDDGGLKSRLIDILPGLPSDLILSDDCVAPCKSVIYPTFSWLHDMHKLSDPTIEAILKEWGIAEAKFSKRELRTDLENLLKDIREKFGPITRERFTTFMEVFDRDFRELWDKELQFLKEHPKLVGAALGVTGSVILAPVVVVVILNAAGFASGGVVAGSLAATTQSIVYGGATGGLFSLLQSAGATMVLPSVGVMVVGVATTGTGIAILVTDEILPGSQTRGDALGPGAHDGDDDSGPPSYNQTVLSGHVFTAEDLEAIVKSWDIGLHNPPGTDGPGSSDEKGTSTISDYFRPLLAKLTRLYEGVRKTDGPNDRKGGDLVNLIPNSERKFRPGFFFKITFLMVLFWLM